MAHKFTEGPFNIFPICLRKVSVDRVFVGPFMTSLDMAGMSLTLLRADSIAATSSSLKVLELLDASVGAPGWPSTSAAINVDANRPTPLPSE